MEEQPSTSEPSSVFRKVGGRFFRSVLVERLDHVLDPPVATSAGRYHRLGQPALYMSASAEWAIMAISGYMREDGRRRLVAPLSVGDASCSTSMTSRLVSASASTATHPICPGAPHWPPARSRRHGARPMPPERRVPMASSIDRDRSPEAGISICFTGMRSGVRLSK